MKYKITLYIAGLLLILSSCKDMDMTSPTSGSSGSWYTTEVELDMAVNEFYLLGYWDRPFQNSEQWTDNFTYRNTHRIDLLYGTMGSGNYETFQLWDQAYKLVARANALLESIDTRAIAISDAKREQYKGEAYFARACKYADLISYYGDVIYLDKYVTVSEALELSRTPKAEVIPLVYADFDKAAAALPVSYGNAPKHFTKGAAYAMKARFALYMGDWAIAAEAAKACMDLNEYDLHADYASLFLQSTKTNTKEKVFTFPRSIANDIILDLWLVNNQLPRNSGGYAAACPSWDLLAAFLCTDGLPIDKSPLFDPREPFVNRDPRLAHTIVEFGSRHLDFEYNPHPNAKKVMNYKTGNLQDNQDTRSVNQYASYNGLVWRKGIDASWLESGTKVETDYIVMRYADVLIMYAEAKIELGEIDQTVLDAINKVRARGYGVPASATASYPAVTNVGQDELRKIVRLERRVEFANEGLRYMDLIRWRLADKALNTKNYGLLYPIDDLNNQVVSKGLWFWPSTPTIDEDGIADFSVMESAGQIAVLSQRIWVDRQYLWPIWHEEVAGVPNLLQNPGY